MNEPTIDVSVLESLGQSTGDDFVRALIDDFLTEANEIVATLHKSLAEQDAASFHRAAHTLKSSGGYMGATALCTLSRELETIGNTGDITAASTAEKLEQLIAEFQQVRAALKKWQQG